MKISVIDASNYFKGLLLLIKRDNSISESEITLMKRIGRRLGFERTFCENAIHDILDNPYIDDAPPVFTLKEIAMKFIKDGLTLASTDKSIHEMEARWLEVTAERNGVDIGWFQQTLNSIIPGRGLHAELEVEELVGV